jgi:RNA polymerase sigma factor (sigma-70 family)
MTTNQFNLMVTEHASSLNAYALKFTKDTDDAQDLIQDTMLKAIRYFHKFDPDTNLKAWLFVIMKNTFINNFRKNRKIQPFISQEELSSANLIRTATRNGSEGNFVMKDIKKAISKIPEAYAFSFVRYFEGYKYHEIAQELNIPIGTVKTRIHQARELLKKQLQFYREKIN